MGRKADVSWFGFPITINEKASFTRAELMNKFAENKIGTRFLFGGNILLQPAYESLNLGNPDDYPNANRVVDRTFWIGVYPGLTIEMLDFVVLTIDEFINKKVMKTLILAGGKGTRFMEETKRIPKPMIPINGKPMIFYIIDQYLKFDFVDFVILGGTKISYIFDYFEENFSKDSYEKNTYILKKGVSVTILDTGEDTMTGGRVKRAINELNLGNFMLTYGDGFCDVNINEVVKKFHEKRNHSNSHCSPTTS